MEDAAGLITVYTDPDTGCQYLVFRYFQNGAAMTPRMAGYGPNRHQMGCFETRLVNPVTGE